MYILNRSLAITFSFWLDDKNKLYSSQWLSAKRPIVVLDSGVGGLTLSRQLELLLPEASILYVVDNEWFPYGSKSGAAIFQRVQHLIDQLYAQIRPLAIVVACNTASVAIKDYGLDQRVQHCFLITPPLEDAVEISCQKNIVLLATPGTLKSGYIRRAMAVTRSPANIWPIAAQPLVALSEARLAGQVANFASFSKLVDDHLTTKQRYSIDTVILGCTHFPHLIKDLEVIFPSVQNWLDPAKKVSMRVASAVKKKHTSIGQPLKTVIFTSKQDINGYRKVFSNNGFCTDIKILMAIF
jgi:glutamate racemase